jgi:hypothetical protein
MYPFLRNIFGAALLFLNILNVNATGQRGERIIYKGDTLEMLSVPLEDFLHNKDRAIISPFLETGCSTALWRGYVGLWMISDGKLYLIDVNLCGRHGVSIMKKLFPDSDGPLFVDWFTGELAIQQGKLILYHHNGFDRHYEREVVVSIRSGEVESTSEFENGVKPDDSRFSRRPNDIHNEIYRRINWKLLPGLSKKYRLYVHYQIGEDGRFSKAEIRGELGEAYRNQLQLILNDFPPIQVFYYRDKPIYDSRVLPIVFSREMKRKARRN